MSKTRGTLGSGGKSEPCGWDFGGLSWVLVVDWAVMLVVTGVDWETMVVVFEV